MRCLSCKDVGMDCSWVGKGETDEEVMKKAKEHTMLEHKEWWEETGSKMPEAEMQKMLMGAMKEC